MEGFRNLEIFNNINDSLIALQLENDTENFVTYALSSEWIFKAEYYFLMGTYFFLVVKNIFIHDNEWKEIIEYVTFSNITYGWSFTKDEFVHNYPLRYMSILRKLSPINELFDGYHLSFSNYISVDRSPTSRTKITNR